MEVRDHGAGRPEGFLGFLGFLVPGGPGGVPDFPGIFPDFSRIFGPRGPLFSRIFDDFLRFGPNFEDFGPLIPDFVTLFDQKTPIFVKSPLRITRNPREKPRKSRKTPKIPKTQTTQNNHTIHLLKAPHRKMTGPVADRGPRCHRGGHGSMAGPMMITPLGSAIPIDHTLHHDGTLSHEIPYRITMYDVTLTSYSDGQPQ
jgi:hypothetical protein